MAAEGASKTDIAWGVFNILKAIWSGGCLGAVLSAFMNSLTWYYAEVAELMATQPSVVARLEAGGGRRKRSPSLATLQKYAEAAGCRLEIKMVRLPSQRTAITDTQPRA